MRLAKALVMLLAVIPVVCAGHLPTHGGRLHLDSPLMPGNWVLLLPGGSQQFDDKDMLDNIMQPWHWENELFNPGGAQMVFPIIFFIGSPPRGVVSKAGLLTIPAGGTRLFDFHIAEHMAIFKQNDKGSFGTRFDSRKVGNVNPPGPLGWDVSITENEDGTPGNDILPEGWQPRSLSEIQSVSHYEVRVEAIIPEPSTFVFAAIGFIALWNHRRVTSRKLR